MTTPTQAQIARLLKLADSGHWRDSTGLSLSAHPLIDEMRTAAAQVEEQARVVERRGLDENGEWEGCGIKEYDAVKTLQRADEARKEYYNATIERCAQVVMGIRNCDYQTMVKIAAALDKLKDET